MNFIRRVVFEKNDRCISFYSVNWFFSEHTVANLNKLATVDGHTFNYRTLTFYTRIHEFDLLIFVLEIHIDLIFWKKKNRVFFIVIFISVIFLLDLKFFLLSIFFTASSCGIIIIIIFSSSFFIQVFFRTFFMFIHSLFFVQIFLIYRVIKIILRIFILGFR